MGLLKLVLVLRAQVVRAAVETEPHAPQGMYPRAALALLSRQFVQEAMAEMTLRTALPRTPGLRFPSGCCGRGASDDTLALLDTSWRAGFGGR